MSRTTEPKADILNAEGYRYSFDRQLYVNKETKKAFSVQFIQDHDEEQLQGFIGDRAAGQGWRFYFNSPPSEAVKHDLESVLG